MELLNRKNIIIVLVAIVVVGGGTYFYQQSSEQKAEAAKSALYQVQKTFEAEAGGLSDAEKTPGSKIDVDAKFPKTMGELNKIVSTGTEARLKYEAAIKMGTLYSEFGKDEVASKAVDAFKKATESAKTDFQKATAFYLLGNTQERMNQVKEAAESFQTALNQKYEGLSNELLLSLVRVNMKAKDTAKAKSFADKLNKDAPGSRAAQEAQKLTAVSQ